MIKEYKKCTGCKVVKHRDEYNIGKTCKLKLPTLRTKCKVCQKEVDRIKNLKKRNSRPKIEILDLPGEMWVPVKGHEEKYRVSNLGRVKSVDRWVYRKIVDKDVFVEGKLLALSLPPSHGYPMVTLYGETTKDKFPTCVYPLVFFSFNPEVEKIQGYEIDHKDQNRANSKLENLQYIPSRLNCIKRSLHKGGTSKYPGVSFTGKSKSKWQAHIRNEGNNYCLGHFAKEKEAAKAYENALVNISKGLHPVLGSNELF